MKKFIYLSLATALGLILSFIAHAIIEILYLRWASSNQINIIWTNVGDGACALPPVLIYLLPILGAGFGLWLGFVWWKKIYGK
ncbi:MAG: hypothetical protein AAB785_02550 [Patescibacteria group bacterium]